MHTIVFSTLAKNQTVFFVGVADELRKLGYRAVFLSFHERSVEYIKVHKHSVFNVFEIFGGPKRRDLDELQEYIQRYGIENLNRLISHEKTSFEENNSDVLIGRFFNYLDAAESAFRKIEQCAESKITLVQEAGGFLSLISAYLAARKNGIDNIFIEPSFFRGRVFFVKNSFSALPVFDKEQVQIINEVKEYINDTIKKQRIAIPDKDSHQYTDVTNKILNFYNIKRLVQKLSDKYLFNYNEEFSHIWVWVRRHLKMFMNKVFLRKYYKNLPLDRRYIYYPLHVPTDFALTIRSPEYLDQYALLDYMARNIPFTHKLVFKEHPALIGAVDRRRIKELLKKNDNIVMVKPWLNNFDVMGKADMVVTVNSKSGAEALLLGKSVIVLGDAFYALSSLVTKIESLKEFPGKVLELLTIIKPIEDKKIIDYFQCVWDFSWPGEIYSKDSAQIEIMADSLDKYLTSS